MKDFRKFKINLVSTNVINEACLEQKLGESNLFSLSIVSDLFIYFDWKKLRFRMESNEIRRGVCACPNSRMHTFSCDISCVCILRNRMFVRCTNTSTECLFEQRFEGRGICNAIYANTYLVKSIRRDLGHLRPSLHFTFNLDVRRNFRSQRFSFNSKFEHGIG